MPKTRLLIVALAAVLAPLALAMPAHGEAIVLRSQDRAIDAGRVVENGDVLRVRSGKTVTLLLPDGDAVELRGPVRYRYREATPGKANAIDAFAQMFRVRSDQTRLGGVRGGDESAARDCSADPPADNWLDIAEDWTAGCRRRALSRLDAELQ